MKSLLLSGACLACVGSAWGFTLVGPYAPWQTPRLGYNTPQTPENLYGGPMNITEEYRWAVPEVYYGFTSEFAQYFGEKGMAEIDKVFEQLNQLPAASQMDPDAYPLRSQRQNFQAAALGLQDIRSDAMSLVMQMMGIGESAEFVYTLRARDTTATTTNYYVIRRNFDPITWKTTPYVNGVLWTYTQVTDLAPDPVSYVFKEPVDPLAAGVGFINAPAASWLNLLSGGYWTTFTRDDIGALRYIYRSDNYNVETYPANITVGSGGPWGPPPGGTNVAATNLNFVNTAIRPGRDKVTFRKVEFDSLFGAYVAFTNQFEDSYITNGSMRSQVMQRAVLAPDILFHAADTVGDDTGSGAFGGLLTQSTWTYGNTNTIIGGTNATALNSGPGTIDPGAGAPAFTVTYNTVNEFWLNTFPIDNQDELTALHLQIWASFDGTTNEPVIYPIGVEVRDVEAAVLRGRGPDPWGAPPNSAVTNNAVATGVGQTTP